MAVNDPEGEEWPGAFDGPTAVGYGWWLGTLADGRDLFFDPAEWFAMSALCAPTASIESLREEFPELVAGPDSRSSGQLSLLDLRAVDADPRVARALIRRRAGRTFELVLADATEVFTFTREGGRGGEYRPGPDYCPRCGLPDPVRLGVHVESIQAMAEVMVVVAVYDSAGYRPGTDVVKVVCGPDDSGGYHLGKWLGCPPEPTPASYFTEWWPELTLGACAAGGWSDYWSEDPDLAEFAPALAVLRGQGEESPVDAMRADLAAIVAENADALGVAADLLAQSPIFTGASLSALLRAVTSSIRVPDRVSIAMRPGPR